MTCPFCTIDEPLLQNDLAFIIFDRYPVNPGYLLLLPFCHVATWFEATHAGQAALLALAEEGKHLLDGKHQPEGYNIGIKVGEVAGQTMMHLHIHLIPRYRGDMAEPRGSVRGMIPAQQSYPAAGD